MYTIENKERDIKKKLEQKTERQIHKKDREIYK